ncbi:HTH-type transcriptional repressor YvoA [Pseudovibrio axinellae]|uniref:HTH-type transcriptional repressor YvoA n=1 Tax=Pseudovibrio axinellae TaxID=989403 RepID=A0A166BBR6_9HYPH|nr:UTRA domain-containing protein [Pseudovibrio axinellae]KZL22103.1 HTH-type transcriptional repressor YvoA [Pseudovibrio axinellae]SEQ55168.1 transcriptional regulator, GntR family [Pseudovibrio axinellae]
MRSYKEIRGILQGRITSHQWQPGDLLPSEQALSEEFGCTRATVNRAMRELADAGLVERRRKAGTRVIQPNSHPATITIPVIRQEIEDKGQSYRYLLLERLEALPPEDVRTQLGLSDNEKSLFLKSLHYGDGIPQQLDIRWINLCAIPEAAEESFADIGPNEWLLQRVPHPNIEHVFRADQATAEEQRLLQLDEGEPVFTIERRTWIVGEGITYVRLVHPGSRYRMATRSSTEPTFS